MFTEGRSDASPLSYALLCEIRRQPRGGYALRRVFETSPMGVFSSSPGSIYPALARLTRLGLIQAHGKGRGGYFEITAAGARLIETWLAQPVTVDDVSNRLDLCLLRFAFLEEGGSGALGVAFLTSLIASAETRRADLAAYLEEPAGRALPVHARLAIEHGRTVLAATIAWARGAMKIIDDHGKGAKGE